MIFLVPPWFASETVVSRVDSMLATTIYAMRPNYGDARHFLDASQMYFDLGVNLTNYVGDCSIGDMS
jgi:hypothetical protein